MQEHPALEGSLELGEALLHHFTSGSLLSDIPVVGILFKTIKAAAGVREALFANKVLAFLTHFDNIPPDQLREMMFDVLPDSNEQARVGEHLLMLLEKVTDRDKPYFMAVFFRAYLHRYIDMEILLRAWDAISISYTGDLRILLGYSATPAFGGGNSHFEYLFRAGLTKMVAGKAIDDIGSLTYSMSDFGRLFVDTFHRFKS